MSLLPMTEKFIPLAEALRPKSLDELVGQKHLFGEGKPLATAFISGKSHSMILWGPPGVGKTTIARLAATVFDCEFIPLSAVLAGVKEIRQAIEMAEQNLQQFARQTILFVDEIHRFNKAQQDALLPFVESGLVTFIGATTENPSFEVNSALLSRSQVYVLKTLSESELLDLLEKAKKTIFQGMSIESSAEQMLVHLADGDARKFLNLLEQSDHAAQIKKVKEITEAFLKESLGSHNRRFDKAGDYFYDQISALHKSVRGSNPDAALYWFCRMIDGGADAKYLARRIVRMAWEDIGLADPRAMQLANDAASTYERLGSPEGELALAEALIYLAAAPKSNAAYTAYNQAKAFVANDQTREVPSHLRNAPTQLMKQLGHGHAYRYAHDEPHAYAAGEDYLPEGIDQPNWYQPADRGLEVKIKEKLAFLKSLDEQHKKK